MTTESQRAAMKRYYEKNRRERCLEMRERGREKAAARAAYLEEHPDEAEVEKEKRSDEYYRAIARANKRRITEYLADEGLCAEFKAFLRACVLPTADKGLPKKFLDMCWTYCAIVSPRNTVPIVDDSGRAEKEEAPPQEGQAS